MRRRLWSLLTCLSTALAAPPPTTLVPLQYRNQHPIAQQNAGLTPFDANGLARGVTQAWMSHDYSSIFEYFQTPTRDLRVDLEAWRVGVGIARGLGHGITVRAEMPLWNTGGGFLDGFLTWYHQSLGLPNAGRELFPNDQFAVTLTDTTTGAALYDVAQASGIVPGDLQLHMQQQLCGANNGGPTVAWIGTVELPTGRRRYGVSNGDVDLGIALAAQQQWGRWAAFAQAGYYFGPPAPELVPYVHADSVEAMLGGGFFIGRGVGVVAQVHGGTKKFHGLDHPFWNNYPLDLMIGFTGRHERTVNNDETILWQIGFSEDLNATGPSIDFTAHAQIGLEF